MPEVIGILVTHPANRQLLADFCAERGWAVRVTQRPRQFDAGEWQGADLLLVDEATASQHGPALLALKRREPAIFLPILVLVERKAAGAGWVEAGFDDVLHLPVSKAELGARLGAFLQLRRQSVEIARRGEAMFRAIVEQSLVGVYLFSQDRFLYVNLAFANMFGYSPEDIIGSLHPLDLVYPDDRPLVISQMKLRFRGLRDFARYRFRGVRKDGMLIHLEAFGRRIDYQGQPAILGTAIDITEQVKAQQRLERVMRALRVLSACNQAIVRAGDEQRLLQSICDILVSIGAYRLAWVGMAEQDEARSVRVVAKAGPAAAYLDDMRVSWKEDEWGRGPTGAAIRTGEPQVNLYPQQSPVFSPWRERAERFGLGASIALPIKLRETTIGALNIYAETHEQFDQEELQLLNELAVDISYGITAMRTERERERTARRLAESEARLRGLVEYMPAGVVLLDSQQRLQVANALAQEYLQMLAPGIRPGDVLTSLAGRSLDEFALPSADGRRRHEISLAGDVPRIFEVEMRSLTDQDSGDTVLVLRDVTRDREVEARIREQERLASVGQLAAGIAHDFNNILTSIIGYAQLVLYEPGLDAKVRSDLHVILDQGQRAAHLIRQLLDFSRKSLLQMGPLDVVAFMKEQSKLLHRLLPESIEIRVHFPTESMWVEADPTSLQQVVTNLAVNARDAMPRGGTLWMRVMRRTFDPRFDPPPWPGMCAGSWILLQLEDTGCGIAPEHLPHIFEPFFTTKGAGKGTGLGLSQVYGIVQQHGGYIGVESQVGRGSTFTVYLPELTVIGSLDIKKGSYADTGLVAGHGERILLVEDDERVREICRQALASAGYEVVWAADGVEALERLQELAGAVDLLITDMVMPRMGGAELIAALRAGGYCCPVLVMTGYPLDQSAEWESLGTPRWIMKPFSLPTLLEKVREALRGAGSPP